MSNNFRVISIKKEETYPWLLKKHYAHRLPPISYAFGLYDKELIGVVTYGVPASSSLRIGICGNNYQDIIIELNRLCLNNDIQNGASILISKSLKLLPSPLILVSYADTNQNHTGYIYQATNWIYTGLSAKRTDWKIKGLEHLHGQTIADISRGQENRADYMRERYGDDFYLEERSRKHRYIYFLGSRKQKKEMLKALKYEILPYPKGDNKKYDSEAKIEIQQRLFS